ncbi:MAG TPA: mechanosensitive ion channel family protein [Trichormus sp.]|jgi:small-conductance mechanosensitive channel
MQPSHLEHELDLAWATITKMVDGFFTLLPNLLIGVLVIAIFLTLGRFTKDTVSKLCVKAHMDLTLARALGTLCSLLISLIGLLTAAVIVIPKFSMASVIGGLGISSVAIGFAFKDILQNFFAGMLLLWQKPFSIGDEIKTQSFEGTVEDIRIRSTLLRSFTGELVLVPNGDIYTNPVVVNSHTAKRRVHITFVAKDAESVQGAREKVRKLLLATEGVLKEPPPQIFVADASSENLTFEIYFWGHAQQSEVMAVTDRVASALREQFNVKKVAAADEKIAPVGSEKSDATPPVDAAKASESAPPEQDDAKKIVRADAEKKKLPKAS